MRHAVGAFVHLNSGSPLLQVAEVDDEGRVVVEWWSADRSRVELAQGSPSVCFYLADATPLTTLD